MLLLCSVGPRETICIQESVQKFIILRPNAVAAVIFHSSHERQLIKYYVELWAAGTMSDRDHRARDRAREVRTSPLI